MNTDNYVNTKAAHVLAPHVARSSAAMILTVDKRGRAPGGWFNIKMLSYQHRNYHCGDKMIYDHLISTMGFPILVKRHLCIEPGHKEGGFSTGTCILLWLSRRYQFLSHDQLTQLTKGKHKVNRNTSWHNISPKVIEPIKIPELLYFNAPLSYISALRRNFG